MPTIRFPSHLRNQLPVPDVCEAGGATIAAVVDSLAERFPGLRHYLLDDQGELRQHVNIFINDAWLCDRQRLSDPVSETDEIYIMQALSGG